MTDSSIILENNAFKKSIEQSDSVVLDQSYYKSNTNANVDTATDNTVTYNTTATATATDNNVVSTNTDNANTDESSSVVESSIVSESQDETEISPTALSVKLTNNNVVTDENMAFPFPVSHDYESLSLKSETESKTPILKGSEIKVGTHDGRFHADEVMGVTLLKVMYEYLNSKIKLFRSRNPEILSQCDIVLDVGHLYNPANRRFDHHQTSCSETFDSLNKDLTDKSRILLSSAGMVWKEFGRIIIELYLKNENYAEFSNNETIINEAYHQIYHSIIKEIDAHDNGQSMIYEHLDNPSLYRYRQHLGIGNTVAKLNNAPLWSKGEPLSESDKDNDKGKDLAAAKNQQFILAIEYMETSLRIHMDSIINEIINISKAIPELVKAYNERKNPYILDIPVNVNSDPKIISRIDKDNSLLYTIYFNEHSKNWSFSTLQKPNQQFVNRKNLLSIESLERLLDSEEFKQVVFVHKKLFCGAAKTHELAFKICELSAAAEITPTSDSDSECKVSDNSFIKSYFKSVDTKTKTIVASTALIGLSIIGLSYWKLKRN